MITLPIASVIVGLVALIWSAGRFVDGAAAIARRLGIPTLLIGIVVVGFGTSAPEIVVSTLASIGGNSEIALGNAYGSNICNIALILGLSALIKPIAFQSTILRKELPLLAGGTLLAALLLVDSYLSRLDATILLLAFGAFMAWTIARGLSRKPDTLIQHDAPPPDKKKPPIAAAVISLAIGASLLIASSRLLVWGAVNIAQILGVSDIIIGLTIVAVGTSMPELASAIIAARKGEHGIALGNAIGSNLFNTLAVVGIAGAIRPFAAAPEILYRDIVVMGALTLSLFPIGYGFKRRQGRISRIDGAILLLVYIGYTAWLVISAKTRS